MKLSDLIDKANEKALEIIKSVVPVLVDVAKAEEVLPCFMKKKGRVLLHAGPPVAWEKMCGPVRGAVLGAIVFEKWAKNLKDAEKLAGSGEIFFEPCHHNDAVGPMAGIVSPSMYVWVLEDRKTGRRSYSTLNEGLGKVLRFGANSPDVLARLEWMKNVLGPVLKKAVNRRGGISIRSLISQALMMGDECHNRNVAGTALFLKEILPGLLYSGEPVDVIGEVTEFISSNPHFFLNLSMAACKLTMDSIKGIENCSLVYAMARNGTEIGIRVAGLGEEWFTAPAGFPKGLYFAPYTEKDANPDLGDSTICETMGLGGFAMAAAPAIVKFIGGTPADAVKFTKRMGEITAGRHTDYQIPALDFLGCPVGIDIRLVVETGITPVINTGIAHREAGIGQIGAGILEAPMEPFEKALAAFIKKIENSGERKKRLCKSGKVDRK